MFEQFYILKKGLFVQIELNMSMSIFYGYCEIITPQSADVDKTASLGY